MKIRIDRDGRTEIKVENGVGDDCLAFTRGVEAMLGAVESRERLNEDTDPLAQAVHDHDQERDTL